ncbi:hypothetical protein NP233_g6765 [Leucocoprinus birnbaumii]|uniref:tRNA-5-taurinomethyluridine 2-sulfurtransferase n=1 Tax=Leucocoprinus birnbaumii TaxID=56174 RepID=A0AAD5VQF8_9AGAR|nr:hypothetical protein NP233_g6765 [Leucocoprinus birnbaumii]
MAPGRETKLWLACQAALTLRIMISLQFLCETGIPATRLDWTEAVNGRKTGKMSRGSAESWIYRVKWLIDLTREYWNNVFQPALHLWETGATPNPDVSCNREIKFGALLNRLPIASSGETLLATGHYARNVWTTTPEGLSRPQLHCASYSPKDQSYYLSSISESSLRRTIFPLGEIDKTQVRKLAREFQLHTAERDESMGICFVGQKARFRQFLASYLPPNPGPIVDKTTGKVVGQHKGIWSYTIGEGARIAGVPERLFVSGKDPTSNTIYVVPGPDNPGLDCHSLHVPDFHWIWSDSPPPEIDSADGYPALVKYRYRMDTQACRVYRLPHNGHIRIDFDKTGKSASPGQVAALYNAVERHPPVPYTFPTLPTYHHPRLNHTNTLPPELLLMIFKLLCFNHNISDTRTTIRISHVSRSWRRLCLASPALWANIAYYSAIGYRHNYVALQKVMTYIGRSGTSPLTLVLEIYSREDEGFQIICEHTKRWKSLSLRCTQHLMPTISTLLRRASVPLLEYLCVEGVPTGRNQDEDTSGPSPASTGDGPYNIFSAGSPSLHSLELRNGAVYYMRPIHLETITTLHFRSAFNDLELTPSELRALLTIPNLTTLTILTEFWELIPDVAEISRSRIIMPKLRYLGIRGQYGSDYEVMRIFATISIPLVEVLMLQNISGTSLYDPPVDIECREVEVFESLHTLIVVENCDISTALHPLLAQTCQRIREIVFDTGASDLPAIASVLLPLAEDGDLPPRPPIVFPELQTIAFRSVDRHDAQHLMALIPGWAEQGRGIEGVVLGLEVANFWMKSGHGDWLKEMKMEIHVEDHVDPSAPMWKKPRRKLIWKPGDDDEQTLGSDEGIKGPRSYDDDGTLTYKDISSTASQME